MTLTLRSLARHTPTAGEQYDLVLAACGFEERARNIGEQFSYRASKKLACAFPDGHELSFVENKAWFESNGYETPEVADTSFDDWWHQALGAIARKVTTTEIRIAVDVSCFNRFRLASIVDGIRNLDFAGSVAVNFSYSLAAFSPPSDHFSANQHVGPVHPSFAGWFEEQDFPVVAVVGLGYEYDKALGAVELLQVDQAWLLTPRSPIEEYYDEVRRANESLFSSIPSVRQLEYPLDKPIEAMNTLHSLCGTLDADHNVVLLPFGPKLYVVECLLLATTFPRTAVWRVSAGADAVPVQRKPSKHIFSLGTNWGISNVRRSSAAA